jgi:hypothetical protein
MKLIYERNGNEVNLGDTVLIKGKPYYLQAIIEPHKPSSTGRVWCVTMDERKVFNEWFPSVIGAVWVNRNDQF